MNTPILECTVTVLDYETTGSVVGWANEPWQIGMVSLVNGKVCVDSLYESFLKVEAGRPFNPHAPGRHALLREEIAAAPTPFELWPVVRTRLTECPLCAHNVGTEKKFTRLMAPMHRFGGWVDTLRISRRVWPGLSSYALGDLVALLGLMPRIEAISSDRSAHDALYDAVASAMLLEFLLEQPGWNAVTVADLAAL